MPAASEAVGAPGGGGDAEQEYEIRNDDGFVYKVPRGLYPDAAPSTTQPAAGPDPKAAGLRRRRRALLRLRAKRLRDLSRWEALASELLAPLPAPQPPAPPPQPLPASSPPAVAAASSSASVLDELLAQVDVQAELMKKLHQWCDEANAICHAEEAAIVDSLAALPVWGGNPADLVMALCSQDEEAPGNLDGQSGLQEASGMSSAGSEMIKNSVEKQTMSQDVPPILTERRMRKRVTNLSGSSVASQVSTSNESKKSDQRKKGSAPSTPRSTMRSKAKAASTPARTPESLGPLTRRRAAGQNISPLGVERSSKLDWRW